MTRPLPVPDDQSAPFWRAAAEHVLTAARCLRCESFTMPPDLVCPHCGSTDPAFEFIPVDGGGVVRSWTVVRQALLPGFQDDLPFVLVDVELDAASGVRLIGRLLEGDSASVAIGAAVVPAFEDLDEGVSIPAFKLAR